MKSSGSQQLLEKARMRLIQTKFSFVRTLKRSGTMLEKTLGHREGSRGGLNQFGITLHLRVERLCHKIIKANLRDK